MGTSLSTEVAVDARTPDPYPQFRFESYADVTAICHTNFYKPADDLIEMRMNNCPRVVEPPLIVPTRVYEQQMQAQMATLTDRVQAYMAMLYPQAILALEDAPREDTPTEATQTAQPAETVAEVAKIELATSKVAEEKSETEETKAAPLSTLSAEERTQLIPRVWRYIKAHDVAQIDALGVDAAQLVAFDGYTPLHIATMAGAPVEMLEILVRNGAKVNAVAEDSSTPLHHAIRVAHFDVVRTMLRLGADVNLRTDKGLTATQFARARRSYSIVLILLGLNPDDVLPVCAVCLEDTSDVVYPCGHLACDACAREALMCAGRNGQTFNDLRCPAMCSHELDPHFVRAVSKEAEELLDRNSLRHALSLVKGMKWCPRCDSGGIVDLSDEACTSTECPRGHRFCRKCTGFEHTGSCEEYKSSGLFETERFMARHTAPCPQCFSPIQKDGGCSHMTCQHCKYQFCWICRGPYIQGRYTFGTECPCKGTSE